MSLLLLLNPKNFGPLGFDSDPGGEELKKKPKLVATVEEVKQIEEGIKKTAEITPELESRLKDFSDLTNQLKELNAQAETAAANAELSALKAIAEQKRARLAQLILLMQEEEEALLLMLLT